MEDSHTESLPEPEAASSTSSAAVHIELLEEIYHRFVDSEHIPFCEMCNGFYGRNHNEPLCGTCHQLICPEDVFSCGNNICGWNSVSFKSGIGREKADSDDSGNEDLGPDISESPSSSRQTRSPERPKRDPLAERVLALTVFHPGNFVNRIPEGWIGIFNKLRTWITCFAQQHVPPEIMKLIFCLLDDLSLYSCARVCKRWKKVIVDETTAGHWEEFTRRRWPLFQPFVQPLCWFRTYGRLVRAAPCLLCLHNIRQDQPSALVPTPPGPEKSGEEPADSEERYCGRRLASEFRLFQSDPPEGIEAVPLTRNRSRWVASLTGPVGSPYEGGKFFLSVDIPPNYPLRPPVMRFLTKIIHPNVSRHGDIGMDILNSQWIPALTVAKVVLCVQSILTDPNVEGAMEPGLGLLYKDNREAFNTLAQQWTWKYAMVDAGVD